MYKMKMFSHNWLPTDQLTDQLLELLEWLFATKNSQDLSRDTPERYSPLVLVLVGDSRGEDKWENEEDDEYSVEMNHVGSCEDHERLTGPRVIQDNNILRSNNIQSTVNKGRRGPLVMKVKFLCWVKGFGGV